ncbi:alpha/beta fold hydrolase [Acetobacter sp.]|uniref:alpha/beta fold hydrolase n=1 Tax=Acetobacter sp. TaxID=440 RepID=UPI0039EACAD8
MVTTREVERDIHGKRSASPFARRASVQIATTPKEEVWHRDKVRLFRFRPTKPSIFHIPVLISYGLIGRWTMVDLQQDRSLVSKLLDAGITVYVADWGNPSRADRFLTLDDYICGYLDDCINEVCHREKVDSVNLFGVCEGGVFGLAYASLKPSKINTLILAITPIDFHADQKNSSGSEGLLNVWIRSIPSADVDRIIDSQGNLRGAFMGTIFTMLTPVRSMLKYNSDLVNIVSNEEKTLNWLCMEKWIADRPDHPGEAGKQWLKDLYQENRLIKNEWELDGQKVNLMNITAPILNIYASADHIIPPSTTCVLKGKTGSTDYKELNLPGGHVGIFVGSRAQNLFGSSIIEFLKKYDTAKVSEKA